MGARSDGQALAARKVFVQGNSLAGRNSVQRDYVFPNTRRGVIMKTTRKAIGMSHYLAAAVFGWGALSLSLPASFWFTVENVTVLDVETGYNIPMNVTRTIKRPFKGEYHVEVRTFSGYTIACEAHGQVDYAPSATFPEPLTLTWWGFSDPRCGNLPDGQYNIKTTWEVERLWGWLPDANVVAFSNFFTVGKTK